MRVLSISRGGLELARAHINRPVATIGRSPTCNVVLRAPGVGPIHFMLEWVGTGTFDANTGDWTILDVSRSQDESGEGVLLSKEKVNFGGFQFQWIEDNLQNRPDIGGAIQASLNMDGDVEWNKPDKLLLELVQIRTDSGAVEEVLHLPVRKTKKKMRPLSKVPQFHITHPDGRADAIRVLLEEMPGAELKKAGTSAGVQSPDLTGSDILQVKWRDHRFFVRFVPAVKAPKAKRVIFADKLLMRLSMGGVLFGVILLWLVPKVFQAPPEEPKEAPRIATIEIKEIPEAPPEPPAPPPRVMQEEPAQVKREPEKNIKQPKVQAQQAPAPVKKSNPGAAAAPRFENPAGPPKAGLNAPAAPADVNTIGILGALRGSTKKGPGVQADKIVNQGLITDSVSGEEARIAINNPAMGVIGTGNGGSRKGNQPSALAGATTTLRGAKNLAPGSVGPIAMEGGKGGYQVGFGKGDSKGLGGGPGFGSLDLSSFEVEGGLDRETVRRVIAGARSQIRACYERSLLSDPKLAGRLVYRWDISPAGPVSSAQIYKSDVGSKSLESCVHGVIKAMVFPAAKNGKPTTVIYPFVFQSKS